MHTHAYISLHTFTEWFAMYIPSTYRSSRIQQTLQISLGFFSVVSFAKVIFAFSKLISVRMCGSNLHLCMCFRFSYSYVAGAMVPKISIFFYSFSFMQSWKKIKIKINSSLSLNLIKINFILFLPIQSAPFSPFHWCTTNFIFYACKMNLPRLIIKFQNQIQERRRGKSDRNSNR